MILIVHDIYQTDFTYALFVQCIWACSIMEWIGHIDGMSTILQFLLLIEILSNERPIFITSIETTWVCELKNLTSLITTLCSISIRHDRFWGKPNKAMPKATQNPKPQIIYIYIGSLVLNNLNWKITFFNFWKR